MKNFLINGFKAGFHIRALEPGRQFSVMSQEFMSKALKGSHTGNSGCYSMYVAGIIR